MQNTTIATNQTTTDVIYFKVNITEVIINLKFLSFSILHFNKWFVVQSLKIANKKTHLSAFRPTVIKTFVDLLLDKNFLKLGIGINFGKVLAMKKYIA